MAEDLSFIQSVTQAALHMERAGRGGRTVTAITLKPELGKKETELMAKALRQGLGCGSHIEDAKIIIQGDNRERAKIWLEKHGVKRVV
jgi:translation initiation factor 1 (eIF-1/SUI1)